jgi:lysophospholipase L1-like esterase
VIDFQPLSSKKKLETPRTIVTKKRLNNFAMKKNNLHKYCLAWQISCLIGLLMVLACSQKTEKRQEKKLKPDSISVKNLPKMIPKIRPLTQDSMPHQYPTLILENYAPNRPFLQAKLAQGDSVKVICYGNSITQGYKVDSYETVEKPYPQTLEKLLQTHYKNPKIKVINEGHNGWRSDQGLANLAKLVIEAKPDWVILEFGINDAYSGFSNQLYQTKIQLIISDLQKNNLPLLLCSPTPILTTYNTQLLEYSRVLLDLARQNKVNFLHWHQVISQRAEKEQVKPQDLLPDKVHFADDKYQWLAEAVLAWLLANEADR